MSMSTLLSILNKVVVAPIDRRSIVMNSMMFKAKKIDMNLQ
jgi:hypothetical protein